MERDKFPKVFEITNDKNYVSADSVLCLGSMKGKMNRSKLGRTKLNGIWRIVIWKIWIASMESRWSSSGKYSQDHNVGHPRRDSNIYDRNTVWSGAVHRQDHLHVNVQRHCMERTKKTQQSVNLITYSCELCSQISARFLVILGTWIRKEMVRNLLWQSRRRVG